MEAVVYSFVLVSLSPFLAYFWVYLLLRATGRIAVCGGGWHASGLEFGGRMLASALTVFCVFDFLMRAESGLRRRLSVGRDREDVGVSEVVVELIPLV